MLLIYSSMKDKLLLNKKQLCKSNCVAIRSSAIWNLLFRKRFIAICASEIESNSSTDGLLQSSEYVQKFKSHRWTDSPRAAKYIRELMTLHRHICGRDSKQNILPIQKLYAQQRCTVPRKWGNCDYDAAQNSDSKFDTELTIKSRAPTFSKVRSRSLDSTSVTAKELDPWNQFFEELTT